MGQSVEAVDSARSEMHSALRNLKSQASPRFVRSTARHGGQRPAGGGESRQSVRSSEGGGGGSVAGRGGTVVQLFEDEAAAAACSYNSADSEASGAGMNRHPLQPPQILGCAVAPSSAQAGASGSSPLRGGGGSTSRHSDERAQHHGSPSRRGAPAGGVGERRVMGGPGTPRAVRLEQLDLEEESLMQSLGRLDARLARPRQGGGSERSGGAAESGRSARPSASIGGGGGGGGKVGGGVRAARNSHDEEPGGRPVSRASAQMASRQQRARQLNAAGASSSEGRPQPQPGHPFWEQQPGASRPITQEGRSRPMTRERRASRASFDGLGPTQPAAAAMAAAAAVGRR